MYSELLFLTKNKPTLQTKPCSCRRHMTMTMRILLLHCMPYHQATAPYCHNMDKPSTPLNSSAETHCVDCGLLVCEFKTVKELILEEVRDQFGSTDSESDDDMPYNSSPSSSSNTNKSKRFTAYQAYIRYRYGHLGKSNRKEIPLCVTNGIRSLWPDPDLNYVGFRPANAH
jgi:hypothetical protein